MSASTNASTGVNPSIHPGTGEALRESATQAVVDNLGLIWPDEAEPMHEEVADGVLAAVRAHLEAHLDRAIGDAAGVYDLTEDEVATIIDLLLPATQQAPGGMPDASA